MTIVDARWQMVLDCLQAQEPLFSQGALQAFRERLIASDTDRRLLERTREVAKRTEEFDFKKLFEEYAFNLGRIQGEAHNVRKGWLIMAWIDLAVRMAARPVPSVYSSRVGAWEDAQGWNACRQGSEELARLADGIQNNSEVRRVLDLWEK